MLTNESITFGKYKGYTLGHVLKDRSYCEWLLEQAWFQNGYEYLYNKIKEYKPKKYFFKECLEESDDFLSDYQYFNLIDVNNIEIPLTPSEKTCYTFYLKMINILREKIYERIENDEENIFDIKAPTKWLQNFEKEYCIPRKEFKEFLLSYDLPNIPYIIERIKKEGGIEYKGAKSFLIAKARSEEQEKWWENILKNKYGEELGTQFKYLNCIFDFINITTNTIFECKLSLKDFNEDQHIKYKLSLNEYRIIYLIAKDCIIDIENKKLYTINKDYYSSYLDEIILIKEPSYLDLLIKDFTIIKLNEINNLF
jgi:hypothetical protein